MFPEALLQDFSWQKWAAQVPASMKQPAAGATRKEKIQWGLGQAPATVPSPGGHYGEQCEDGASADGCYIAECVFSGLF